MMNDPRKNAKGNVRGKPQRGVVLHWAARVTGIMATPTVLVDGYPQLILTNQPPNARKTLNFG